MPVFAAASRARLGFLEFSLGENAAMVERLRPLVERFLEGEAGDPGRRQNIVMPDVTEALVGLGRVAEAEGLLGAWERAGERFERARIRATALRCRALLAAAQGELGLAVRHAEAALEHHRDLPVPFERARTLIVLGTLHRRAKHKAAARAALEEAVEILDAIGVPLWVDRARAELGRIGRRTSRASTRSSASAHVPSWRLPARLQMPVPARLLSHPGGRPDPAQRLLGFRI